MTYTTYLFDFDYTLADSSRGIVTCFRNVLTRHNYLKPTDEDIKRTIGKTLEDSFSILTGVTDPQQLAVFKKEYVKEADTFMTANTFLFPETKSVLTALKNSGARIGIISTKYRYRIKDLLNQHFPEDFLDIIIGGEDVKAAKPSPEGILLAIGQLNVAKSEVLYIGDSTVDAETAQAAEVDFAGVTHGVTTAEELAQYPHRKIMATLEELLEEDKEEQPVMFRIENPIHPESKPSARRKKKMINVWQILLLLFLFWMSIEELKISPSFVFPLLFVLTFWGIRQKRKFLPDKVSAFIEPWWHPCRVWIRACHIKLIRGKGTPPTDNQTSVCQNCGTVYTGNYCNRCGQSRNTPRYRLSNALRNIAGGFFNIDSGFGRTLIELLHRPGYMIRDYIGGKRIPYFRPFQTLFILAALYIMTVQLVDPEALTRKPSLKQEEKNTEQLVAAQKQLQAQLEQTSSQVEKEVLAATLKSIEKSLEKAQGKTAATDSIPLLDEKDEEAEVMDELLDKFIRDKTSGESKINRILESSPFLTRVWNLLKSWGHGNKAFSIIATLPLFALATQLAFRRRKYKLNYNLTEHIFIQAYIACQVLLLSILIVPLRGYARVDHLYELPVLVIFLLFWWDYKQLYRCTWWRSFWRTLLMFVYSLILLIVFAIVATLLGLAVIHWLNVE